MSFELWWGGAIVLLLVLAALAGRACGKGPLGILIDGRGRYSLNHLQIVFWTILVLSTLLALFFDSKSPLQALSIPRTLIALMGISVGSAASAGAIKSGKEVRKAAVQVRGVLPAAAVVPGGSVVVKPHLGQIVLQEEGPLIDQVVDVTKFQNLIFTLVIGATYVTLLIQSATDGNPRFPELDSVPNLLWLLGVSHAGYLAGKLPDKPTQSSDGAIRAALAARGPLPPPATKSAAASAPPPATPPPAPTWENRIRDQFNVSDVAHMLRDPGGTGDPLDLGSYESVKANGQRIYDYVLDDRMPLPPSSKWTQEMKDAFKAWMDGGYPER